MNLQRSHELSAGRRSTVIHIGTKLLVHIARRLFVSRLWGYGYVGIKDVLMNAPHPAHFEGLQCGVFIEQPPAHGGMVDLQTSRNFFGGQHLDILRIAGANAYKAEQDVAVNAPLLACFKTPQSATGLMQEHKDSTFIDAEQSSDLIQIEHVGQRAYGCIAHKILHLYSLNKMHNDLYFKPNAIELQGCAPYVFNVV
jgi:hypothetical protein